MQSLQLIDKFKRPIKYARIAITDRCNLRCFYCMPESGVNYVPRKDILSYEEIVFLITALVDLGINKVRFTGGEPFLRKGFVEFLKNIRSQFPAIDIGITTNGVLTAEHLPTLKRLNVHVNLSLDSLDRENFKRITHRDEFDKVMLTLKKSLDLELPLKINMVVIKGKNEHEILEMASLAGQYPLSVRFIEEMPFNGEGRTYEKLEWDHERILSTLKSRFPDLATQNSSPTASIYKNSELKGSLGIIAAYSRTFCSSCDRIRISAQGQIQTCLYAEHTHSLKQALANRDSTLTTSIIRQAVSKKARNGLEAEAGNKGSLLSMSSIGG